jgi:thioesterase domain-containing protein/acyl carrier protein
MIPTAWVPMSSFPMAPNGKIDRRSLPEPPPSMGVDLDPGSSVSVRMAAIWSSLLGVETIGMSDSFFDLGGDSLAAAGLLAAVEQEFGCRIPMADLFERDTFESMCSAAEAVHPMGSGSFLVPIKRSGDLPPLYCLHRPGWTEAVYWNVSRHVNDRRPVIGVLDPVTAERPADLSVVETARRQAEAIRDASEGPYYVMGYSGAGVIAYEVGRQLASRGADVDFVGMVDSGFPEGWSFPFRRLVRAVRRIGVTQVASQALFRARHRLGLLHDAQAATAAAETVRRDMFGELRSFHRHRVQAFDGPVIYFRAAGRKHRTRGIRRWRRLVREVVDVAGTHGGPESILGENHADSLALAIESAIAKTREGAATG